MSLNFECPQCHSRNHYRTDLKMEWVVLGPFEIVEAIVRYLPNPDINPIEYRIDEISSFIKTIAEQRGYGNGMVDENDIFLAEERALMESKKRNKESVGGS